MVMRSAPSNRPIRYVYIYNPKDGITPLQIAKIVPYLITCTQNRKAVEHQIVQEGLELEERFFLHLPEDCRHHFDEREQS